MSLIDQLRDIETFTPSAEPSSSEIAGILGRLIAYVEHGEEFLRAVEADVKASDDGTPANNVNELLSPPPPDAPPAADPAPVAPAPAADDRDTEIAGLRQQLATAQAQLERTQVAPTPGTPESAKPAVWTGGGATPPKPGAS